jgi:hypothetical protein
MVHAVFLNKIVKYMSFKDRASPDRRKKQTPVRVIIAFDKKLQL